MEETAKARSADLLAALKPRIAAHNKAVLAGALVGLVLGIASVIGGFVVMFQSRAVAGLLFGLAVVAVWRAVAFHRMAVFDAGPARKKAAELLAALIATGGKIELVALCEQFEQRDLLAALDVLGRLDLVYAALDADGLERVFTRADAVRDLTASA